MYQQTPIITIVAVKYVMYNKVFLDVDLLKCIMIDAAEGWDFRESAFHCCKWVHKI